MRHARSDYNRIQDPAGLIAEDEPVFLIRAKDAVSGDAVRAWADLHDARGGDPRMSSAARQHAVLMDAWQPKQSADAPQVALIKAAKRADWMLVVLNQGPPCFHLQGEKFCLCAERWAGHDKGNWDIGHKFVSLADLLATAHAEGRQAGAIHEDALPEMPQAVYDALYPHSWVPNGVGCRVFPSWSLAFIEAWQLATEGRS